MFENLRDKASILFSPKNKSFIAQSIQNPAYKPDSDERNTQLLFWGLIFSAVSTNDTLDKSEQYLFEDYVFEQCISEKEWKQVRSFKNVFADQDRFVDASKKLSNSLKKPDLFKAFKAMVSNDKMLRSLKPPLLSMLESGIKENVFLTFKEWGRSIVKKLSKKRRENDLYVDSSEYLSNPAAFILKKYPEFMETHAREIIGAKLGLALIIIYSDLEAKKKEKQQFRQLVEKYCSRYTDRIERMTHELIAIPEEHLEMAYLGRFLVEVLDKKNRKELLKDLFQIARVDNEYNPLEDRDLRVISKYLLLDHEDFIDAKLATKNKD